MSSLVRMISPSAITPGGGAGCVPTAITILSAEIFRHPSCHRTISECGSAKRCLTSHHGHVVPSELLLDDVELAREHLVHLGEELLRRGPRVGLGGGRAVMPVGDAGEEEHCLSEGLARDRACAETYPAQAPLLFDDGRALAELGGLHRRALPRGPAADADEIVVVRRRHPEPPRRFRLAARAGLRSPAPVAHPATRLNGHLGASTTAHDGSDGRARTGRATPIQVLRRRRGPRDRPGARRFLRPDVRVTGGYPRLRSSAVWAPT